MARAVVPHTARVAPLTTPWREDGRCRRREMLAVSKVRKPQTGGYPLWQWPSQERHGGHVEKTTTATIV